MYLMCRLCLEEEGLLEVIFDIDKSLIDTISLLFELKQIIDWPSGICMDCKSKLASAKDFFNTCRATQKTLIEQLGETPIGENIAASVKSQELESSQNLIEVGSSSSSESTSESSSEEEAESVEPINLDSTDSELLIPMEEPNNNDSVSPSMDSEASSSESISSSASERDFSCEKCLKSFAFKSSLANHMRSHDSRKRRAKESDPSATGINPKRLKKLKSSQKVLKSRRKTAKKYECPKCHKILKTSKTLRIHKATHSL